MSESNPALEELRSEIRSFVSRELTPELRAAAELGFGITREQGAVWHRKLYEGFCSSFIQDF